MHKPTYSLHAKPNIIKNPYIFESFIQFSMSKPNLSDAEEEQPASASVVVEVNEHEESATIRSLRVPKALIKAKREAYVPQMVSLGPYHHSSLKEEVMDLYKLNSAKDATKDKPTLLQYFFDHVKEMASEFQQFYNIHKIEDSEIFDASMMMDGFFLYQVLKNGLHDLQGEVSKRNNEIPQPTLRSIRCDIMKLENQIPLSLLFEIDNTLHNKTLGSCLNSHIPHLSCFQLPHSLKLGYEDEPHLLACVHKYVSSFLHTHNPQQKEREHNPKNHTWCERIRKSFDNMVAAAFGFIFPHPAKQGRGDFLDRYNTKELVKGGIKFKPLANVPGVIRFEKDSSTIFLPKIVISDPYTDVVMRNLLALEFNDPTRPKNVSHYVELMNMLIETPEDVCLLRECNVIDRQSMMITDEYVVKMWDGLAKTLFFSGFVEKPQGIKAAVRETLIKNYYKRKIRNWLERHLWRPFRL